MAVDDANLDMVVDADVDGLLTSTCPSRPSTHRRTPLALHLPDGGVDAAHAAPG